VARLKQGASLVLGERKDHCLETARRLAFHHPRGLLKAAHTRVGAWDNRLGKTMETRLHACRSRVNGVSRALRALSPAGVLSRGYCLARDPESHRVLSSASDLAPGAPLVVQFLKDRAHGRIEKTETGGPHELEALESVWEGNHDGEEEDQDR
jgi:exonuclease VII large subunit